MKPKKTSKTKIKIHTHPMEDGTSATNFDLPIELDNPPRPSSMVDGMRNIGYTPQTALADLVDNSITAESKSIFIRILPSTSEAAGGYVVVEDNGKGMSPGRLVEAMRWGGDGPTKDRDPSDLGRFGLGLKTASFSMGRKLTVATREAGGPLKILCWDLDYMAKAGWKMQDGLDHETTKLFKESKLAASPTESGTVVIVTKLDRLGIHAPRTSNKDHNSTSLTRKVSAHLGMVFHRFIEEDIKITLGASEITKWDPFFKAELTSEESIGEGVKISSYTLPHHSRVTVEEYSKMEGQKGWNGHQGYFVYRAKRLIVPGGWVGLFNTQENCRLSRIRIDLPNMLDASWNLNVIKSRVAPPSWMTADLVRIGRASRSASQLAFSYRGNIQAPQNVNHDATMHAAFWNQIPTTDIVEFRINRAHPMIQTLKQSVKDPAIAEAFLRIFERVLPMDAILQDPKRTSNGLAQPPNQEEIQQYIDVAKLQIRFLHSQGHSLEKASEIVLSLEPFVFHNEEIRKAIN